ncbi:MAG: STAS domain-containing protein [Planctomycetota bacterium]
MLTLNPTHTVLRILLEVTREGTTVRLEGQLRSPSLDELRRQTTDLLQEPGRLFLDLTDLRYADPEGIAALLRLVDHGATIRGASIFVRQLLRREP